MSPWLHSEDLCWSTKRTWINEARTTLVSARAILTLAANGDDAFLSDFVDAFADNAILLGKFLRALSSAAEESASLADTARRVWPGVVARILELNALGHTPFNDHYFGDMTLAALLPNAAGEGSHLYRELDADPFVWWDPLAWREAVERWLPIAAGHPTCIDHLLSFLSRLPRDEQVRLGLRWVITLVVVDPDAVARRSFLLPTWLIEIRSTATDQGLLPDWQRVVDALVVAGVSRLAPYSE